MTTSLTDPELIEIWEAMEADPDATVAAAVATDDYDELATLYNAPSGEPIWEDSFPAYVPTTVTLAQFNTILAAQSVAMPVTLAQFNAIITPKSVTLPVSAAAHEALLAPYTREGTVAEVVLGQVSEPLVLAAADVALAQSLAGGGPPPVGDGVLHVVGPAGGLRNALSTPFVVTYTGTLTGTVVLTPSDGGPCVYSYSSTDPIGTVSLSPTTSKAWFYYLATSLGVKTITFTVEGGGVAAAPASHTYTVVAQTGSATPFKLTRGGSTLASYARLQQCWEHPWAHGDVVKVAPGTYAVRTDATDVGSLSVRQGDWPGGIENGIDINLTIEAEDLGNPPFFDYSALAASGVWGGGQCQAITAGISGCRDLTIRGLHMRGHRAPAGNGEIAAAFWQKTDYPAAVGPATVFRFDRCYFKNWGDAVKTKDHTSTSIYVNECTFEDNSDAAAGLHHDIYTSINAYIEVIGSTFRRSITDGYQQHGYGHFVKSRCRKTIIRGCLFDALKDSEHFGGANSLINTPNGGEIEITGNIFLDDGMRDNNSAHNILRSGETQMPSSIEVNHDPLLLTHSYLIAQNTMRMMRGYTPDDGNTSPFLGLFHNPTGDINGVMVASGIPTQAMTGTEVLVDVTTIVRNNICAHEKPIANTHLLSLYPNNTVATPVEISRTGYYSGGIVAGSPAVNDAPLEWGGDFLPPVARTDTNRGARIGTPTVPTWVPSTAWQWTEIPGTKFTDYTYLAPLQSLDPINGEYTTQWQFGGWAYSRTRHEGWLAGGGHDATTINALWRVNLNSSTPSWVLMCPPTPEAVRAAEWAAGGAAYQATAYHAAGGGAPKRPKSPHAYSNNVYFDDIDEFCMLGIAAIDEPAGESFSSRQVAGFARSATEWRAENSWLNTSPALGSQGVVGQLVFASPDHTKVYYGRKGDGVLHSYAPNTGDSVIGGDVGDVFEAHAAAQNTARALLLGGTDVIAGNGQNYWGRWINLLSGSTVTAPISGYAFPITTPQVRMRGLEWIEPLGAFVLVLASFANIILIKLTPTGGNNVTAELITTTGASPTALWFETTAIKYDPVYGVILIITSPTQNLFCLKV